MHNEAFHKLGLNWVYLPLSVHVDQIEKALKGLIALGFRGANVTTPHKEVILPFMNELSLSASAIKAVNTISITPDGKLIGDNTDAMGFLADLKEQNIEVDKKSVLILGAGGSSRAILYTLLKAGCPEITLLNRNLEKANLVAKEISSHFGQNNIIAAVLDEANIKLYAKADLIINCTSLGMKSSAHEMPWFQTVSFRQNQTVYDLIYYPDPTTLLKKAKQDGAHPINGLGMLVHQGALSFSIWTEQNAPIEVMKKALSR